MRVKKAGNEVMCALQCCSVHGACQSRARTSSPPMRNRADAAVGRRRKYARAQKKYWPPARAHALDRGRMHASIAL